MGIYSIGTLGILGLHTGNCLIVSYLTVILSFAIFYFYQSHLLDTEQDVEMRWDEGYAVDLDDVSLYYKKCGIVLNMIVTGIALILWKKQTSF